MPKITSVADGLVGIYYLFRVQVTYKFNNEVMIVNLEYGNTFDAVIVDQSLASEHHSLSSLIIFNRIKNYVLLIIIMISSCSWQSTEQYERTIFVANDYLIYQDQRFTKMSELLSLYKCDEPIDVFISPLVNTTKERFSYATADFMKMCGEPEKIIIETKK
jgi:hypothetical protein